MVKVDGDGRCSGERMTPCDVERGGLVIMGRRQGTPGWADDPVW